MTCASCSRFFEVFANKTRLRIIGSIYEEPKNVNQICEDLGEEQSKISHNLKVLLHCGFVEYKQEGKTRLYFLKANTIKPVMDLVNNHMCGHCNGNCEVNP
jgi:ArsR family transcriptional regulator, lead/cadmium/zinc/bismuth-responsive transcriptional repressor